jgi:hypothetical protein
MTTNDTRPATAAVATTGAQMNLTKDWASEYGMAALDFYNTVVDTCFPGKPTKSQWNAFALVARNYNLDPVRRQVFAFPAKGGGIVPIVGVDGWLAIVNRQPTYDGVEFEYHNDKDGKLEAITCTIHHKDRKYPTRITEYMDECVRNTPPWQQSPRRQLRHKSFIQCGRVAFSLSGIFDEDEGATMREAEVLDVIQSKAASSLDELATQTEVRAGIAAPAPVEVEATPMDAAPEAAPLASDDGSPEGAFADWK